MLHATASAATSISTTRADRTRAINLEPRRWCTSHRCISLRPKQPDPAASTYESSEPVQINGASSPSPSNQLVAQANAACDGLGRALVRIQPSNSYKVALPELIALRIWVEDSTRRWLEGSDRQTPSQADR